MKRLSDFYVYIYFDSRKPGEYNYGKYKFDYEPIYVGKGTKNRYKKHLTIYKNSKTHFHNKLGLIIKEGFPPLYEILINGLSEDESNREEINLIKLIGREENGGILTNLTNGGEGQSGLKHKEESKLKTSNSLNNNLKFKEYMKTKDFSDKVSIGLMGHKGYGIGIPRTDEVKKKISESMKGRPGKKHTDDTKNKMSINNSGIGNPNSSKYILECPNGDVLEFIGRISLKEYITEFNNLTKSGISFHGIIKYGTNKGFTLIDIIKVNQL